MAQNFEIVFEYIKLEFPPKFFPPIFILNDPRNIVDQIYYLVDASFRGNGS